MRFAIALALAAIILADPIAKGFSTCMTEQVAQCPEFFK